MWIAQIKTKIGKDLVSSDHHCPRWLEPPPGCSEAEEISKLEKQAAATVALHSQCFHLPLENLLPPYFRPVWKAQELQREEKKKIEELIRQQQLTEAREEQEPIDDELCTRLLLSNKAKEQIRIVMLDLSSSLSIDRKKWALTSSTQSTKHHRLEIFKRQKHLPSSKMGDFVERHKATNELPINSLEDQIISCLKDSRVLLLQGGTGCGKVLLSLHYLYFSYRYLFCLTDCVLSLPPYLLRKPKKDNTTASVFVAWLPRLEDHL